MTNCILPHSWILTKRERGGSEWVILLHKIRRERGRERERAGKIMITQCAILLAHLDKNPSKHVLPFSTADCDPLMVGQFVLCTHNHHIFWCLLLHKLSLLNFFLYSSTTFTKQWGNIRPSIVLVLCAPWHVIVTLCVCSTCIMHTTFLCSNVRH